MKLLLTFTFAIITSFGLSQNWKNLVPNYSFEVVTGSYPVNPDGNPNDYYCHNPYSWTEKYWAEVQEWTHPLKRQPVCIPTSGQAVGTANVLPTNSRSGINKGHGSNNEFLVTPLWHGGLQIGSTYFIEFFKRNGGGEKMYFSNGQTQQCSHDIKKPYGSDGVILNAFTTSDNGPNNWERHRFYYYSPLNLDWMTLGVKGKTGGGTGGASWDDLRIYEVQPNKCRENWYFDNTVFNYPMEVFQASNNIYIGNGVDPENGINHIAGDVIQYASSSVVLKAGNQIIIDPGTFIEGDQTKIFEISPEPCSDNLCPDELTFENEILCNIPSKVIGTEGNEWGTTVSWSPSTYLNNPSIANPTFSSPGGVGAITYEVEVTYTCDVSELTPDPNKPFSFSNSYTTTHEVVVQYTNINDPNSNVSANILQEDVFNYEADFNFSDGVTEITVELSSSPGYSETFYRSKDFNCCSFNWVLPNAWAWSSCSDDVIKVTAKNKCSGDETVLNLPWNKSQIPFSMPSSYPNVVTANNDGVNDNLCFDIESADYYDFFIINRWGNIIFESSGDVTDSRLCFDGSFLSHLSDGTYSYVITLGDICGNSEQANQFFSLFTSSNKSLLPEDSDTLNNLESSNVFENSEIILSPNPTNSLLNINSSKSVSNIVIFDEKGREVFDQSADEIRQIDVSYLSSGMYYCKVEANDQIYYKKFVKL